MNKSDLCFCCKQEKYYRLQHETDENKYFCDECAPKYLDFCVKKLKKFRSLGIKRHTEKYKKRIEQIESFIKYCKEDLLNNKPEVNCDEKTN